MEYEKKRIRRRISLRTWPLPKSGAVQCSKLSSLTGDPTGINYLHERLVRISPMLAFPSLGIMQNDCKSALCTNVPQFNAHDLKLLAALTQWFVAESIALVRHAVVKVVIKPETVMAAVTMTSQHFRSRRKALSRILTQSQCLSSPAGNISRSRSARCTGRPETSSFQVCSFHFCSRAPKPGATVPLVVSVSMSQ
jgi:hypothetical protein